MQRIILLLAATLIATRATAAEAPKLSKLEQSILNETNRLRKDPKSYVAEVEAWRKALKDGMVELSDMLRFPFKDKAGIDSAVAELKVAKPMAALTLQPGLCKGARDHAADQGKTGKHGHIGADGSAPNVRVARYAKAKGLHENLAYGPYDQAGADGRFIIAGLLIDPDVPDRGHRKTLMTAALRHAGVACGAHPGMGQVCVLTYSEDYKE